MPVFRIFCIDNHDALLFHHAFDNFGILTQMIDRDANIRPDDPRHKLIGRGLNRATPGMAEYKDEAGKL